MMMVNDDKASWFEMAGEDASPCLPGAFCGCGERAALRGRSSMPTPNRVVDAGRAARSFDGASTLVVDYGIKAATVNMAQSASSAALTPGSSGMNLGSIGSPASGASME
jgi:hypothetical protein